ncbi:MAG TPA: lipoyl(octanoyl) transferase LipB [Candidatus Acidoferrales bacterium]|nr:lipoyl(octanoyl) transferase LipB [Candidatus Acidoferrales bacterium]
MTTQSPKTCWLADLGLVPYAQALDLQHRVVAARKAGALPDVVLLCEHPHVITQGRNGRREHLLGSERVLEQMGVEFFETRRGGDVTYHGPGQLVAYPIFDLSGFRRDLVWFVRRLEDAMMAASAGMGIPAERLLANWEGKTGVWVRGSYGAPAVPPTKLGAIGVHVSRWVTSHGLAWNVSTDLRYFDLIVPCGIAGCLATSVEQVLGRPVDLGAAARRLAAGLGQVFGRALEPVSVEELTAHLAAWEREQAPAALPVSA